MDERPIGLTYVELELLLRLAQRPGKLAAREALSSILSHDPAAEHSEPLNTHISRLRKKLRASHPWQIKTVWKRGYMLQEEETTSRPTGAISEPRGRRMNTRSMTAGGGRPR